MQVQRFGKTFTYYAKKETILSAGAIGSPQILMLSGIGPKEELKKHNIPAVKDLPVGKNLQEHVLSYLPIRNKKPGSYMIIVLATSKYCIFNNLCLFEIGTNW